MRLYSDSLERYLTPGEVKAITEVGDLVGHHKTQATFDLHWETPVVVLVHVVSETEHEERLYVNEDLILADMHPRPEAHVCAERIAVLLARALGSPLDERRVASKDYADRGHAMTILAFSATTDWPQRGGFAK